MGKTLSPDFYYKYSNKSQEIYHTTIKKFEHQEKEWVDCFKKEFIKLCLEDKVIRSAKDVTKPPLIRIKPRMIHDWF